MNQDIPWVEKYRPCSFENIILEKNNKKIINTILHTNDFPNLLFFGPPGTGKTTTITNLIRAYQEQNGEQHKELIIHLNASDDRGIDIIRNQIMTFVNSKHLFNQGIKFVILDEVDYMTKSAQLALKSLIENYTHNTRFCLICNYITKIETALQYEFVRLKFNALPQEHILRHLTNIVEKENLFLENNNEKDQKNQKDQKDQKDEKKHIKNNKRKSIVKILKNIIRYNNSDVRSMINILQNNASYLNTSQTLDIEIFNELFSYIQKGNERVFERKINNFVIKNNMNKKEMYIYFFFFLLNKNPNNIGDFLSFYESIFHANNMHSSKYESYFFNNIIRFFPL